MSWLNRKTPVPAPAPVTEGLTTDRNEPGLQEVRPDGQRGKYLVLSEEERAKGYIRPVRTAYVHAKSLGGCGAVTTMSRAIAETYASRPDFYGRTFCSKCGGHYPVGPDGQFIWDDGSGQLVGT